MPKPVYWTPDKVTAVLERMIDTLKAEDKAGKIKTFFIKELFFAENIRTHNWDVNVKSKYENEDWYKELWTDIKDRMHIRLCKMGIQNPKLTGLVIWWSKVNFGERETTYDTNEEMNVKLDVKELE